VERLPLFEENFSKNILSPHIQEIAKVISDQISLTSQPGWMTGLAGMGVFLREYGDCGDRLDGPPQVTALAGILEKIVGMVNDGFSYPTLAAGLTGIVWTFRYLGDRGLIDHDDAHVLDELIPFIQRYADHELKNGNFDALHGGTGPGIVGLIDNDGKARSSDGAKAVCLQDTFSSLEDDNDLDLGLAHGLTSLIVYFSENCKGSSCHPCEGRDLLVSSITKLLSHADLTQKLSSVFPTRLIKGQAQYPSRLAWCYGDVGIAMGLLHCAQDFKVETLKGLRVEKLKGSEVFDFAVEVLVRAAERRDSLNTRIIDPYFCHGASGLAFMFYKAWVLSNNDKLKEAAQFWTKETIRFLETTHPPGKIYKTEGVVFGDGSLLNGLSGIGLALLAIERGVLPGWEKGLLI